MKSIFGFENGAETLVLVFVVYYNRLGLEFINVLKSQSCRRRSQTHASPRLAPRRLTQVVLLPIAARTGNADGERVWALRPFP